MTPVRYLVRNWIKRAKLRWLIHQFHGECAYCHCTVLRVKNHPRQATIDHVFPRSRGGNDVLANLALACATCNRRKGSDDPEVYLDSLSLFLRRKAIEGERQRAQAARG